MSRYGSGGALPHPGGCACSLLRIRWGRSIALRPGPCVTYVAGAAQQPQPLSQPQPQPQLLPHPQLQPQPQPQPLPPQLPPQQQNRITRMMMIHRQPPPPQPQPLLHPINEYLLYEEIESGGGSSFRAVSSLSYVSGGGWCDIDRLKFFIFPEKGSCAQAERTMSPRTSPAPAPPPCAHGSRSYQIPAAQSPSVRSAGRSRCSPGSPPARPAPSARR